MKLIVFTILCFSICISSFDLKPQKKQTEKKFDSPPKGIENYVFGYNDLLSSLLWVRVLQDIEICDQKRKTDGPKNFDPNKDRLTQVLNRKLHEPKCEQGWVYKMLDVITDLTPDFYMAYSAGGNFLSVLVDDRQGASNIHKKGLMYFPNNWQLLYQAGYHELFEMQNPEESALLLRRAAKAGAPTWVYSLSAKLYSEVGQALFAKTILESVLEKKPNSQGIDRVKSRLDEINRILRENAQ